MLLLSKSTQWLRLKERGLRFLWIGKREANTNWQRW